MRKFLVIFFLFILMLPVKSQQMPLYSQYMMNGFIINSAMAGYDGYSTYNLTSRQQWLGFESAPRTFSFTAQTRMLKRSYMIKSRPIKGNIFIPARKGRVGVGVELYNDKNGDFYNTGLRLAYAYHIPFPNAQLSFGLSGAIAQLRANYDNMKFRTDETKLSGISDPVYIPDANVGIFFENRYLNLGFSAAQLLQSNVKFGNSALRSYELKRHYYFLATYKYTETARFIVEPSALIKTTEQFIPQADFTLKVYYVENYWFGVSYRTVSTAIIMVGMKIKKMHIGYAFDYGFNKFQTNNWGSHELTLSLKLGDNAKRYRWLSRF
jgi:type IX secretion system PorP/SprF family membrane protein